VRVKRGRFPRIEPDSKSPTTQEKERALEWCATAELTTPIKGGGQTKVNKPRTHVGRDNPFTLHLRKYHRGRKSKSFGVNFWGGLLGLNKVRGTIRKSTAGEKPDSLVQDSRLRLLWNWEHRGFKRLCRCQMRVPVGGWSSESKRLRPARKGTGTEEKYDQNVSLQASAELPGRRAYARGRSRANPA